ncbi:transcription initiation factor TFIID subunit 8 isoform X2 [Arabidopsis lyrata subsp. lyrata]|uniref:transcription initiation factor TFIID subunit 8 isoform X2 n=1 Tax=Arabidopsis lyrata subsp. lyrata TaxID=81972 RepID=UPI000A29E509|nr:transcription initiation factor TFIID subunit 8 isoform X2 [Arabidopsis lyrata subsp. lyrata]|eukprot:XP_020875145.1 transcription initiation factor TFIID subunit 8 isoform X2 [Arabidopsis lyrata subsp. lyrata]
MSTERAQDGDRNEAASSSRCSESYEFSHAAAKAAVAQVCESVGYEHFKDPALESLAGFALQYILQLVSCPISGSRGPVWKEFSLVSLLYFQTK